MSQRIVPINFKIPEDIEREFRQEVARRFGYRKGAMTRAIVEAIQLWLKSGK